MPFPKAEKDFNDGASIMFREIVDRWFRERDNFMDEDEDTGQRTPLVTVDLVLMFTSGTEQDAITVRGIPRTGKIKINNLIARAKGQGDLELILDGDRWRKWSPEEREAVVDSYLYGVEIIRKMEEDGRRGWKEVVKRDDHGRPKLRIRPHDFEIGGYHDVAAKHGENLPAVQTLKAIYVTRDMRQTWFPFADEILRRDSASSN